MDESIAANNHLSVPKLVKNKNVTDAKLSYTDQRQDHTSLKGPSSVY